jgi:hypothetical protein
MSWQDEIKPKSQAPKNLHNLNVHFGPKNIPLREWLLSKAKELDQPESVIVRALIREAMTNDETE